MKWYLLLWLVLPQTSGTVSCIVNNAGIYDCGLSRGMVTVDGSNSVNVTNVNPNPEGARAIEMEKNACMETASNIMQMGTNMKAACQPRN